MAPAYTGPMRVQCDNKGFVGMLSSDAVGIYVCARTLIRLSEVTESTLPAEKLRQLGAFCGQHAERAALAWALE